MVGSFLPCVGGLAPISFRRRDVKLIEVEDVSEGIPNRPKVESISVKVFEGVFRLCPRWLPRARQRVERHGQRHSRERQTRLGSG